MTFTLATAGQSDYHHRTKLNKKLYKTRKAGEESHKVATRYDPTYDQTTPMGGFAHYGIVHGDSIMIKHCCIY